MRSFTLRRFHCVFTKLQWRTFESKAERERERYSVEVLTVSDDLNSDFSLSEFNWPAAAAAKAMETATATAIQAIAE